MEAQLTRLEREVATLQANVATLNTQLTSLTLTVVVLNDTIQRSKGVLVGMGILALGLVGGIGAGINALLHKL